MVVKVNYLGMLVDQTGKNEESVSLVDNKLATLDSALKEKYPILKELPYNIVVNHEVAPGNLELQLNDEIALLPPFAGG
ncbi:MAG: MoaD/ThiS family protein [Aequorivita sp.]